MNQPLYKAFVEDTTGGGGRGRNTAQARRVRARENREARWLERQAVEQVEREAVLAQQAALSAQNFRSAMSSGASNADVAAMRAREVSRMEASDRTADLLAQQSAYASNYRSIGEPGLMYNTPRVDDRSDAVYLTQAQWDAMTTNPQATQNNPYASIADLAAARRLRVENGIGGVRGELPLPAAAHSFDNEFVL